MTPQQEADRLLDLWRLQSRMGIAPRDRTLPNETTEEAFTRAIDQARRQAA